MTRCPRTVTAVAALVASCLIGAASLEAQTDYSNRRATSFLTAGLGFAGGASMTLSPPEGNKVGPIFAWRLTGQAAYPLSPSISAMMELGLDNRGSRERPFNNTDLYTDTHIGYFSINPGFMFSSFYVGMNFGFPVSGSYTNNGGTVDMSDASFDKLQTIIEPRVGAIIPLMNNKSGWMGLSILGGITLNEIIDRGTVSSSDDSDYHLVSAHLGLFYQFSIPGTGK